MVHWYVKIHAVSFNKQAPHSPTTQVLSACCYVFGYLMQHSHLLQFIILIEWIKEFNEILCQCRIVVANKQWYEKIPLIHSDKGEGIYATYE